MDTNRSSGARVATRAGRTRWRLRLTVALCLAGASAGPTCAESALELRQASVVATPHRIVTPRFRLSARLQARPARPVSTGDGARRIEAVLGAKAAFALCPAPGAIFADGYESP
jgi:hypothetical protein